MALNGYLADAQRLLNDESGNFFLINDLTSYINRARSDIARQSGCITTPDWLITTVNTQSEYPFSQGAPGTNPGSVVGSVQQPISVNGLYLVSGGARTLLEPRPWQWVETYFFGFGVPPTGTPTTWTQRPYGESSAIILAPVPNGAFPIIGHVYWDPIPLVNDTTPEALTQPWTDAVAYFAAYNAMLNAQRHDDAQKILALYERQVRVARIGVSPLFAGTLTPTPPGMASTPDTAMLGSTKPAQSREGAV